MLIDSYQRAEATNPEASFIVQAPAGSGKTEILTQRFLRLLSRVSAPEQIVALTFTRKAASEMRERVLLALQQVARGEEAKSAHQQQTHRFAADALHHSQQMGWHLLDDPGRLRIITIDALCQLIAQSIPLQEKQVPFAGLSDKPDNHYQAAAKACLRYAMDNPELNTDLECLLYHLDNRQDKLLDLFGELLANREQWLGFFYLAREQSQQAFEQMLATIEEHELHRFKAMIPYDLQRELCDFSREVIATENNPSSTRFLLHNWHCFNELNSDIARGLAAFLLTSDGVLRKEINHHAGLKKEHFDPQRYALLRNQGKELIHRLEAIPDFADSLLKIKALPRPQYEANQWGVLQALFNLLPLLVAHLHLVFSEANEVDFSAVAMQALGALGSEDEPTDLALYLDNAIHHLLIDEFQDTSIGQFRLMEKLVHGWQPGDGRSLFIVGDPMQSIYRFRQAEVGLFLKAQQNGLGSVRLTPLELSCNFRSTATIVNWVNQQFKSIFPSVDDMESGAISFHHAIHVLPDSPDSSIQAFQYSSGQEEAQAIVELIQAQLRDYPDDDIAVLVRSRAQLKRLIPLLRKQAIEFQGVDIELLARLPHLRDLWSLTQALIMPANRLAWLALLRSPLCGLQLVDIHYIATLDKKSSILANLARIKEGEGLSQDGYLRAKYFYQVMQDALVARHQHHLVDWIENTYKKLHGSIILSAGQQADLEQFWLLLERFSKASELPDLAKFKEEFEKLYSQRITPARLQIMTIHKSKGLEFDTIILPGLSSKSPNRDKPLLRWLQLPSQTQDQLLLVSPVKAAHEDQSLLYDYLGKLDEEKSAYEMQRLLYVAATRAKKRLFLFDGKEKEVRGSFRALLKTQEFLSGNHLEDQASEENTAPLLARLPLDFYQVEPEATSYPNAPFIMDKGTGLARLTGIIAHELLQWICDNHPDHAKSLPWTMVQNRLRSIGLDPAEQTEIMQKLKSEIEQFLSGSKGQWIAAAHDDEHNEYELIVNDNGQISTRIIDRTFVDEGKRWIIDFKTGGEDDSKQRAHREQLELYASLLNQNLAQPIYCGIYYLASGHWVEWQFNKGLT